MLAEHISKSKHFICFTGAGLSTATGIPDYRSTQDTIIQTGPGAYEINLSEEEKKVRINQVRKHVQSAKPSISHMALYQLVSKGYLKHVVSQNTDSLHLKSGIPYYQLTELHGNTTLEYCVGCSRIYFRDFRCRNEEDYRKHLTGRKCTDCKGDLADEIVHFGEPIPQHKLIDAFSLQYTPLDEISQLRIHSFTDQVLEQVCKNLDLEIPKFQLKRRVLLSKNPTSNSLEIYGTFPYNNYMRHHFITRVEYIDENNHIYQTQNEEPHHFMNDIFDINHDQDLNGEVEFRIHFTGNYNEPYYSLKIPRNLVKELKNEEQLIQQGQTPNNQSSTLTLSQKEQSIYPESKFRIQSEVNQKDRFRKRKLVSTSTVVSKPASTGWDPSQFNSNNQSNTATRPGTANVANGSQNHTSRFKPQKLSLSSYKEHRTIRRCNTDWVLAAIRKHLRQFTSIILEQQSEQQYNQRAEIRVQNGGQLNGMSSSLLYPIEKDIKKIQNLEIKPIIGELDLDSRIQFDNFSFQQRFRPSTTQSKRKVTHQNVSVLKQLSGQQSRSNFHQRLLMNKQSKEVSNRSPSISISKNENLLLQQLKEVRRKFAKEDSSVQMSELTIQDPNKKSLQGIIEQSINTNFLKQVSHRVNKRFSVEEKLMMQLEQEKNDRFFRIPACSNRIRVIHQDLKIPPIDMAKQGLTKASQNYDQYFDPLRLKILVIPFKDANPIGKNADYFFLKGFKYAVNEEFANALHSYMKGLEIKDDHLLCRFNLGVILFRIGLYEEAYAQYQKLIGYGYGERTVVIYNKTLCALQLGKYEVALESAETCINIIKKRKSEQRDKEMLGDLYKIIGVCHFRLKNVRLSGKAFEESKFHQVARKRSLSKQIQEKLIDHIRNTSLTINNSSIQIGGKMIQDNSIQAVESIKYEDHKQRPNTRNETKIKGNLQVYLTEIEQQVPELFGPIEINTSKLKRRKSLPITPLFMNIDSNEKELKPSIQNKRVKSLDSMNFEELISEFNNLILKKSDPDQAYLYIDDKKEIRLDKILDLPNSFEKPKQRHLTDQEKHEKLKREGIEQYYNPERTDKDINEHKMNYFLESFIDLQERDLFNNSEQKNKQDQEYQKIISQLKKFNNLLDSSLNYFFNDSSKPIMQADKKAQLYNDAEKQINEIKSKIFEKSDLKPEIKVNEKRSMLKVNEINSFIDEYLKEGDKNYDTLEQILLKLKSFKNMNKEMRKFILQHSKIIELQQNQVLYSQGTIGNHYYYLIRGSVTLISNREEFGNFDLFIKTYYDGDSFGEQPILMPSDDAQAISKDQAQKLLIRDSTCICNEYCIILEVKNEVKQELYSVGDNSKDLERNLKWLRKLSIFTYTETFYLLQMVFCLEKRVYKYGEYLTKSGEVPIGMFIITKGQCLCVFETIGLKKSEVGNQYSRYQKEPKNFQTGNIKYSSLPQSPKDQIAKPKSENLSNFKPQFSVFNQLKSNAGKNFQSSRIYIDDEGKHMPNYIAYQDNVIFSRLVPGDVFGVRTLLPQEEIVKRIQIDTEDIKRGQILSLFKKRSTIQKILSNFQKSQGPVFNQSNLSLYRQLVHNQKTSALSVFADSNEVEVLILKPELLNYLPENQKESLYNDIVKTFDPDNPSSLTEILKQKTKIESWQKQKQNVVEKIRKSQFMERHQGVYKR